MKLIPENEADKTKDVFVGMWREPWFLALKRRRDNGVTLPREDTFRQEWLSGQHDEPLYHRITDELEAKTLECYSELLMAVARKFPDETRHQTALRYIQEAEPRALEGGASKEANS